MKPAAGRGDAQILISRPKTRTADSSSKNAVSFSSALATRRFPFAVRVSIVHSIAGYKPLSPIPKARSVFIGAHNEPLPVVAMCVNNRDRSPAKKSATNCEGPKN
jgi:hypothetical protein